MILEIGATLHLVAAGGQRAVHRGTIRGLATRMMASDTSNIQVLHYHTSCTSSMSLLSASHDQDAIPRKDQLPDLESVLWHHFSSIAEDPGHMDDGMLLYHIAYAS